jgi:transposase
LDNVRYRTGKRAKVHFDFVTLVNNGMKLASLRLAQQRSPSTVAVS